MFILRKMNVIQPVRFSFKIVVTSRLFAYIPFNLLIRVIIRYYCSPTTRRIFNVTFAGIFFRRVFIRIGKYISQYLDKSLQFKIVAILKIAHVFEYRQDKKVRWRTKYTASFRFPRKKSTVAKRAKKAAARPVKTRKGYSRQCWLGNGRQPLIPTIFTAATVLEVSLN